MYTADVTGAHILLTYSDIFKEDKPDLIECIKNLNMHKAISIICELLRVRDSYMEPVRTIGGEFRIPFETVLKKEMCEAQSPPEQRIRVWGSGFFFMQESPKRSHGTPVSMNSPSWDQGREFIHHVLSVSCLLDQRFLYTSGYVNSPTLLVY